MSNLITGDLDIITFHDVPIKLLSTYDAISSVTKTYYKPSCLIKSGNLSFREKQVLFIDTSFFQFFNVELLSGKISSGEKFQAAVTESFAKQLFGESDALNQTITIDEEPFIINAVIKEQQTNSHLQFKVLLSVNSLPKPSFDLEYGGCTYIQLFKKVDVRKFEDELNRNKANLFPYLPEAGQVKLQHFPSIYSDSRNLVYAPIYKYHDSNTLWPIGIISLLILAVAVLNFSIFSQVRTALKVKELLINSVLGGDKRYLIISFLIETCIIFLLSVITSILSVWLFLPVLNEISETNIQPEFLFKASNLFTLLGLVAIVTALITIPAITFGSQIVKGFKKQRVLSYYITIQISIALTLISLTAAIFSQIEFMQSFDVGFSRKNILELNLESLPDNITPNILKNEFSRLKDVTKASICTGTPITGKLITTKNDITINQFIVDSDYFDVLDINIEEKISFSDWPDSINVVMISRQAAIYFLLSDSIGHSIKSFGKARLLAGIISDLNAEGFYKNSQPSVFRLSKFDKRAGNGLKLILKLSKQIDQSIITELTTKWDSIVGKMPFEYRILEDDFNNLLKTEKVMQKTFTFFAVVALVIMGLGLTGIMYFYASKKKTEFAVRRILGASISQVLWIPQRQVINSVGYSSLISCPVFLYLVEKELQKFSTKISLPFHLFIMGGITITIFCIIIVSITTLKFILVAPHKTIKSE